MNPIAVFALLCLVAAQALANVNHTTLHCAPHKSGVLRLISTNFTDEQPHVKHHGYVNANESAIGFGLHNKLLAKSHKPLHAELFKCNHHPHPERNVTQYQLRAHGKCATLVHGGFGVQVGLQFENCTEKLAEKREQWVGAMPIPNATRYYGVVPNDNWEIGDSLLSLGVVSSYFDALAFSYNGIRNDKAVNLALVLDTEKSS